MCFGGMVMNGVDLCLLVHCVVARAKSYLGLISVWNCVFSSSNIRQLIAKRVDVKGRRWALLSLHLCGGRFLFGSQEHLEIPGMNPRALLRGSSFIIVLISLSQAKNTYMVHCWCFWDTSLNRILPLPRPVEAATNTTRIFTQTQII